MGSSFGYESSYTCKRRVSIGVFVRGNVYTEGCSEDLMYLFLFSLFQIHYIMYIGLVTVLTYIVFVFFIY